MMDREFKQVIREILDSVGGGKRMPSAYVDAEDHLRVFLIDRDAANSQLVTVLAESLAEVLRTGLNGGDNMRLAYLAAGQKALSSELLAKAEASERAVTKARAVLALVTAPVEQLPLEHAALKSEREDGV